jgi:hypothetical protein
VKGWDEFVEERKLQLLEGKGHLEITSTIQLLEFIANEPGV